MTSGFRSTHTEEDEVPGGRRGHPGRREGGGRGAEGEEMKLPAVVPFSSADEESLEGRVAPCDPNQQSSVIARVRVLSYATTDSLSLSYWHSQYFPSLHNYFDL